MRLEMLVGMQIEILDDQSSALFSIVPFEKRPVITIEDFVLHSDDHFESHLLSPDSGTGCNEARLGFYGQ